MLNSKFGRPSLKTVLKTSTVAGLTAVMLSTGIPGQVIESFAESYVHGETPIPCVTCNNEIKFRDLLETAKDLGAEVLVTGHYVQRRDTEH